MLSRRTAVTIHHLCIDCIHTCKQDVSVGIVSCPRREVKPTESEFRDLIDELGNMERETDALRTRAHELIDKALRHGFEGEGGNESDSGGGKNLDDDAVDDGICDDNAYDT